MGNKNTLGTKGEAFVAKQLENSGFNIARTNYHSQYGEIDIIAIKGDVVAFVEVKTRKKDAASALWDITKSKQKKIIKTALLYIGENNLELQPSFDVAIVSVYKDEFKLDYYENAFTVSDF